MVTVAAGTADPVGSKTFPWMVPVAVCPKAARLNAAKALRKTKGLAITLCTSPLPRGKPLFTRVAVYFRWLPETPSLYGGAISIERIKRYFHGVSFRVCDRKDALEMTRE